MLRRLDFRRDFQALGRGDGEVRLGDCRNETASRAGAFQTCVRPATGAGSCTRPPPTPRDATNPRPLTRPHVRAPTLGRFQLALQPVHTHRSPPPPGPLRTAAPPFSPSTASQFVPPPKRSLPGATGLRGRQPRHGRQAQQPGGGTPAPPSGDPPPPGTSHTPCARRPLSAGGPPGRLPYPERAADPRAGAAWPMSLPARFVPSVPCGGSCREEERGKGRGLGRKEEERPPQPRGAPASGRARRTRNCWLRNLRIQPIGAAVTFAAANAGKRGRRPGRRGKEAAATEGLWQQQA